ncbi:MAG: EamA family transporter [Desulfobacterales bacterium]|nr:EamA family transporter [Desulfobacterales bacterium]
MFRFKVIISFLGIYLVWGTGYLGSRYLLDVMPSYSSLVLRFALSFVVTSLWVGPSKVVAASGREIQGALISGFFLIGLGTGPIIWAVNYVPTGVIAVLVAILPVWFILFERLLLGRVPLGRLGVLGLVISIFGSLFLAVTTGSSFSGGFPMVPFLAIFFSCMCWALGSVLRVKLELPRDGLVCLCWQMVGGVACNLVFALILERHLPLFNRVPDLAFYLTLAYMVLGCSLTIYLAYNFLLVHVSPTLVSTHSYVNPVVALYLGWLLRGEPVTPSSLLASAVILLGVACIQMGIRREKKCRTPGMDPA